MKTAHRFRCNRRLVVTSVLLFVTLLDASGRSADPDGGVTSAKLPVPKSLAQIKPDQVIHGQYKVDFAAHDAATKAVFSRKLLEAARNASNDPPMRWVLLREAREQAIDAGDLNAAFAVIDAMNDSFAIEPRIMKVSAMTSALDKALVPPAELTETYLKLVDAFLDDGDTDLAHNAAQLASDAARNARDSTLKPRVSDADKRVAAARREAAQVAAALRKLKSDPTDPDASLLVGKYACFVRGQWPSGLVLLAQCNDSKLKELAQEEASGSQDAPVQARIADGWWAYAQSLNDSMAAKTRAHAAKLYKNALPGLSGAARDEAERRVQSSAK